MTIYEWLLIGGFSLLAVLFLVKVVFDLIWHQRLNRFKAMNQDEIVPLPKQMFIKNAYVSVLSLFVVTAVVLTHTVTPVTIGSKQMIDAKRVSSSEQLSTLLEQYATNNYYGYLEDAVDGLPAAEGDYTSSPTTRSYTDTNVQVEGVDEADVIKTDGYQIYYAPAYSNQLNIFDVADNGDISLDQTIDLGELYVEGLFLTDTQVILIGYEYTTYPFYADVFECGWYYVNDTATVQVYDREDMSMDYQLTTDSHFYQYRLIDDMLYLFSQKYMYYYNDQDTTTEFRPYFETERYGVLSDEYMSYDDIYYFENNETYNMMVVTSINLTDYTYSSEGFITSMSQLYANTESFYVVTYYGYYDEVDGYKYESRILKYRFDTDKSLKYVATGVVEGYIESQYWMDEYDGYFRIVTSDWSNINRLYIFEEDPTYDQLNQVALVDEGIGLTNERVKSVRFNGDIGQIVTFETHDPLYTVDLSDPTNPVIQANPIEENGYSTYLHVWNQDNYLVGFGFDADIQGFITGLKLSAYDTNLTTALDTYSFSDDDANTTWSYSEAIYNPRALLINVEKGLFGFPVSSYNWDLVVDETGDYYSYYYHTYYYIFQIDFSSGDVIGDPIIIEQDASEYYNYIDRGVEIENKIYTFSRNQVVVYDLDTRNYSQTLDLI